MHRIRKIYCRTFQTAFKIALPFLPYRTPEIIGSVKGIPDILNKRKCTNVLIITDKSIRSLGLTKRLEKTLTDNNIPYSVYDKTVANPTTVNVAEALDIYYENGCDCLIGFGGGSSMDCAKAVGARIANERNLKSTQKASSSHRHSDHCRNRKRDYSRRSHHRRRNKAQICNQRFSADSKVCRTRPKGDVKPSAVNYSHYRDGCSDTCRRSVYRKFYYLRHKKECSDGSRTHF